MKTARLLGIITYLLNHEQATASLLAERFEVSIRTIQRDVLALGLSGIPITAVQGARGGYRLADGWRLTGQLASADDFALLLTAVRGLSSGLHDLGLNGVLEKLTAVAPAASLRGQGLQVDLGVMRESGSIIQSVSLLRQATEAKRTVCFQYTDGESRASERLVEPLAVIYRWYAWYLFAFCQVRQDYRLFRLSRMQELRLGEPFASAHPDWAQALAEHDQADQGPFLDIRLRCPEHLLVSLCERFPKASFQRDDLGRLQVELHLPEREREWLGWLMSYGGQIEVLEPEGLRSRLRMLAEEILGQYPEEDRPPRETVSIPATQV